MSASIKQIVDKTERELNKMSEGNAEIMRIALGEYGVTEIRGNSHCARVLQYFEEIGYDWIRDDETAWCSAFANWVAQKAGLESSGKLDARSWLRRGVRYAVPKVGDVVVFWRESRKSWKGHVAFFVRETDTHVYVLGGNQNNQVNIKPYPKSRVLGYRTLRAKQ